MTRREKTIDADYFESLYARDPDPWRFATSTYEREKYAATLSALPRERYRSGLEIGCSIGVLTRQVASRCDRLLSIDVAAIALEQAQERCGDLTNVSFMKACIPSEWPDGSFDILLLSEVLYYLKDCDVASVASRLPATMPAGGDIVLVHWLGETDYPLTGDEAADLFIAEAKAFAALSHQSVTEDYRVDVLQMK